VFIDIVENPAILRKAGGMFMKEFMSCKEAVASCINQKRFTIAYLCQEEKTLNMHIHDCYEIYYSISGAKQFLIDNRCYGIVPGDVFVINNYESHYISQVNTSTHERIVFSVFPEFLQSISSSQTDLSRCFCNRAGNFSHKIHLDKEQQNQFIYLTHKIVSAEGYGADITETATFMDLMILLNELYSVDENEEAVLGKYRYNKIVGNILEYINQNITERITISALAGQFFLSEAYICRLFKAETGTTINKYMTARRISIAKTKLAGGCTVSEACEQSGFRDYTNFVQVFNRIVGLTPKRFEKCYNR
jgi:AraC-like DNA-binding protein